MVCAASFWFHCGIVSSMWCFLGMPFAFLLLFPLFSCFLPLFHPVLTTGSSEPVCLLLRPFQPADDFIISMRVPSISGLMTSQLPQLHWPPSAPIHSVATLRPSSPHWTTPGWTSWGQAPLSDHSFFSSWPSHSVILPHSFFLVLRTLGAAELSW